MCDEIVRQFHVSDNQLQGLVGSMGTQLEKGLNNKTHKDAEIKMFPCYITNTPNGEEVGDFLALDLGGTNFRILLVKILSNPEKKVVMDNQLYPISTQLMTGTGTQLFDHLVECLWEFLVKRDMMCQLLPIGFTFSFPTRHLGIDKTVLVNWSKGYTATGVVGEDIGKLLNDAINKKFKVRCLNFDIKIMSTVVNDTVGTMVSCGYDFPATCMGLIVGTGTNLCYMEAQSKILTLECPEEGKEMCINTEWGAFGDNSKALDGIKTQFDIDVDEHSPNKGQHIYEKMISGMYMGELVRIVILELVKRKQLFHGIPKESILYHAGLSTAFVSKILSRISSNADIIKYLTAFKVEANDLDCEKLKSICLAVSTRAANLCAVGIVAIAKRIQKNRGNKTLIVGVDGSVYTKHPLFKDMLVKKTKELAPDVDIRFELSTDGSGRGAALVAAVEARVQNLLTTTSE